MKSLKAQMLFPGWERVVLQREAPRGSPPLQALTPHAGAIKRRTSPPLMARVGLTSSGPPPAWGFGEGKEAEAIFPLYSFLKLWPFGASWVPRPGVKIVE